jgi:hypothetical protein
MTFNEHTSKIVKSLNRRLRKSKYLDIHQDYPIFTFNNFLLDNIFLLENYFQL